MIPLPVYIFYLSSQILVEDLGCADILKKTGKLFAHLLNFIWVGFVGRSWLNRSWMQPILSFFQD